MQNKVKVYYNPKGETGNIFFIMAKVKEALKDDKKTKACFDRVKTSKSYKEALDVIGEYVELIATDNEK